MHDNSLGVQDPPIGMTHENARHNECMPGTLHGLLYFNELQQAWAAAFLHAVASRCP